MKIIKIIGIVLLSIVAIALIAVSVISPKAHLERSIVVNAPPAAIFQQCATFENFNAWSPWAKMDAKTKYVYEGPASGVGAKVSWESEVTGKGTQETVEFEENKRIKNALAFEGMEGATYAEIRLEEVPEGTKVTWTYDSDVSEAGFTNASMSKMFHAFMLEGMLGKQYQEGLNDLKKLAESTPVPSEEPIPADSTAEQQ